MGFAPPPFCAISPAGGCHARMNSRLPGKYSERQAAAAAARSDIDGTGQVW